MSQEIQELEIITEHATSLSSITKAEIDSQISTAKRYPRSIGKVKQAMIAFATLDEETAAGCFFTLPGRKGGDGKPIQGPSVRLAEIALSTYQNIRAGSRVIDDDGKIITAQGICHDLENNVCVTVEVKRRVTTKEGRRFSDDMVVMTGNAACSIALRNATFRVIPLALVKPVYEQAKTVAIGDGRTLVSRRSGAVNHFMKMGVKKEQILSVCGVSSVDDIGLEHLEILLGYSTAIKDGDTSIDEVFNGGSATGGAALKAPMPAYGKKSEPEPEAKTELSEPAEADPILLE